MKDVHIIQTNQQFLLQKKVNMKFETKIKIQDWIIKNRNYFSRGQGFIYDFKLIIQSIFYATGTLYIYFGIRPPIYLLFILSIAYMLFFWRFGKFLDKAGYFNRLKSLRAAGNP